MRKWIRNFALLVSISFSIFGYSQDELLDLLESEQKPVTDFTIATFKNTRLVSGHSVELNGKGVLQFLIGHRFGRVNGGFTQLYGLDNATIRLGFEYGLTDNLNIGIGRSSFQKEFDGTVKWRFARQKKGASNFPLTMTWLSTAYVAGDKWAHPDRTNYFSSRISYYHSLLIARKFRHFSLQVSPAIMHRNIVPSQQDHNSLYVIGSGVSVPITGSLRFNAEYFYILPDQISSLVNGETVQNSMAVGVDIETGGHVFQLHFTNSRGMTEKILVGETTGDWLKGDIHFGFNVSRVFTVRKPKELKDE